MTYFDYLNKYKIEDTKNNFINYLIEIKNYTKEQADNESNYYY